jgi:hypothetical protein
VLGEDAGGGAAGAAYRDGFLGLGLVTAGGGDGGERDLERLGVDDVEERERCLHLAGGGLYEAVGALAGGGVGVGVRGRGGLGDDELHDAPPVVLVGCLGPSAVFVHLGGPPGFPGCMGNVMGTEDRSQWTKRMSFE